MVKMPESTIKNLAPELSLFAEISTLIEQAKATVVAQANHTATMLYWKIGNVINTAGFTGKTRGIRQADCVVVSDTITGKIWQNL
ncbi:MAG: hypothetical protein LBH14_06775 [Desulfobulbaceae bacterium]|jgi:hypothetical protein|nr:hypothetical protein [Desulfobulbaceae bacterium]